ncbi:MAG: hypothetical protein R3A52_01785 [Polyangiales bacterium]
MRTTHALPCLAALVLSQVACATGRLPNTDVPDTAENRSVIAFCERYRHAVERRDARSLLEMASRDYYEDSGTPTGEDDYGYDGLGRLLTAWADEVREVRYEIRYRRVTVSSENPDRVYVDYTFTGSYTLTRPESLRTPARAGASGLSIDPVRGTAEHRDDEVWYRRVADNRLELVRDGDNFKILAGM